MIPANYIPQPILCLKSNVSNIPKGTNGTATGKKVTFSAPLTSYKPLDNPFKFQNVPVQQQQPKLPAQSPSAGGGRFAVNLVNNPSSLSPTPLLPSSGSAGAGANTHAHTLHRPASASAVVSSTAAAHFMNNAAASNGAIGGINSNNNISTSNSSTSSSAAAASTVINSIPGKVAYN